MSEPRAQKRAAKTRVNRDADAPNAQPARPSERQSQVTLQMRQSLHKELARLAFDSGMTMRGYIMLALKKAGLNVTDADLIDRRRREDETDI